MTIKSKAKTTLWATTQIKASVKSRAQDTAWQIDCAQQIFVEWLDV